MDMFIILKEIRLSFMDLENLLRLFFKEVMAAGLWLMLLSMDF